jgi:uncharacterized protein
MAAPERIQIVDALRGFALAGIAIVHFGEQYLGFMPPPGHRAYAVHGTADGILEALLWLFIRGKGFGLFSLLFGLSFALQMQRAFRRDPSRDFRPRFVWRLSILFAIGWLHGLVYAGDILTVYALLGLPLIVFHRVPDRWLFAVAALLLVGTPRVVQRVLEGRASPAGLQALRRETDEAAERHWNALVRGDVAAIARVHATEGFRGKWEFQFGPMGRGYQTFALFLVGLWAGRRRAFEDVEARQGMWRRAFRWSGWLTLAIPILAAVAFLVGRAMTGDSGAANAGGPDTSSTAPTEYPDFTRWPLIASLCVFDAWNAVMTVFYVSAFVLLFQRPRWQPRLMRFAAVGKVALSSYVAQTLVGAWIFFGLGLGLLGRFGNTLTVPSGALLFALQTGACAWWLERFRFGPLEWLWRSLTWMRWEPFRVREQRAAA